MSIPLKNEIHYPETDGRPPETQIHGEILSDLRFALVRRYADVPDVYVWGNLFLYYREGDPRACVTPDVFLVKGVGKKTDNPAGRRGAGPVARGGAEASSRTAGVRSTLLRSPPM
jgi:hypothetical protein